MGLKTKHWVILGVDAIFLFNMTWFFNVASNMMNYLGIGIIILLIIINFKLFKK